MGAVFHLLTIVSYGSCAKRSSGLCCRSRVHRMLRHSAPFKIYNGKTLLGRKSFLGLFPRPVVGLWSAQRFMCLESKRNEGHGQVRYTCKKSWGARASAAVALRKNRKCTSGQKEVIKVSSVSETHLRCETAWLCSAFFHMHQWKNFRENICSYLIKTAECQVIKCLMRWHVNFYSESQKVNKRSYLCSTK